MKRPNILMFMTDNQPAELLGCYGNAEIHTPHIDALAGQGMRFTNAFCVNGMCSPCRASVMTGLMPSQHGIHTWIDDRLRAQWPPKWNAIVEFSTLPEVLQANGYKTALIGKYHIGDAAEAQNGFQHWVTNPHGHVTDFWDRTYIDNGREYAYPGHSVDFFTEKTVEFLTGPALSDEQPFFAFVPFNAPYGHWPALKGRARNRFRAMYDHAPMHSVPREGLHEKAIERFLRKASDSVGGVDHSSELRIPNDLETLRNYYSEMSMVDDGVGRILAALNRLNLDADTLVIYTTDHGFSLGQNGVWGHAQATLPANAYRATFSIPLIVRHPGHVRIGHNDALISQIDLPHTLLDYLDLDRAALPANSAAMSFNGFLKGDAVKWRDAIFMEQEETRAIRTERWLYKHRFAGPATKFSDELYDLFDDPNERTNLVEQGQYADIAADLRRRIADFFAAHADPRYDLWNGGVTKSNSDKPWLWQEAWGPEWAAVFPNGLK